MASIILKRSSSMISRRALATFTTATLPKLYLHQHHPLASSVSDLVPGNGSISFFHKARDFHAKSGPLYFRVSLPSQAEFAAVDDYEGNAGADDEGLEIAKLGISSEIVSALAKKGITKLFPIQVLRHNISLFFYSSFCLVRSSRYK